MVLSCRSRKCLMGSLHFQKLEENVQELKRAYLDVALASNVPTGDQQEFARAFVVFCHAELEWFVERICVDLADLILQKAVVGTISNATLAMLTFSALDPVHGGESLGRKKTARSLPSRVGDAVSKFKSAVEGNDGLREKHLAKLLIPLGIDANAVDSAWLADVDSLCTWRGAFAHVARSESNATHLAVNPTDIWNHCQRVVWGAASGGRISSFQALDEWCFTAATHFSAVTNVPLKFSLVAQLRGLLGLFKR